MVSNEHIWLPLEGACEYLGCDNDYLMRLIAKNEIPYSKLPHSDQIRFSSKRLDEWLISLEIPTHKQEEALEESPEESLPNEVFGLFEKEGFTKKARSRYTNYYIGLKVRAQLHEIKSGGLALAIPEADYLPEYENLSTTNIEDLVGFWGANSDWLKGNSKRFTKVKAKAFQLPDDMYQNPSHPAWDDISDIIVQITKR